MQAYRLRWSIELLFKQFKSTLKLHEWSHGNEHRLQCEILGTLIVAAIIMTFHGLAQALIWKKDKYKNKISFEKLFKFFKNNAYELFDALESTLKKIQVLFQSLFLRAFLNCKKESRKSRPSSLHAVFINTRNLRCKALNQKTLLQFC